MSKYITLFFFPFFFFPFFFFFRAGYETSFSFARWVLFRSVRSVAWHGMACHGHVMSCMYVDVCLSVCLVCLSVGSCAGRGGRWIK